MKYLLLLLLCACEPNHVITCSPACKSIGYSYKECNLVEGFVTKYSCLCEKDDDVVILTEVKLGNQTLDVRCF